MTPHDAETQTTPETVTTLQAKIEAARRETRDEREHATRAFLSYSRRDTPFVLRLMDALEQRGIDVWLDQSDIPKSAVWRDEIAAGIESCDAFIVVVSPDSVASSPCKAELDHAVMVQKRILPVVCAEVHPSATPPEIERRNWIFMRPEDDQSQGLDELVRALTTDLDWVRMHTYLLERAIEWEKTARLVRMAP